MSHVYIELSVLNSMQRWGACVLMLIHCTASQQCMCVTTHIVYRCVCTDVCVQMCVYRCVCTDVCHYSFSVHAVRSAHVLLQSGVHMCCC